MPIQRPSRVLLRNIPLKFVSDKVGGGGAKPVDSQLPLVPIIDLLICMVVFLLMSFSASGELLAQKPSITLPTATNVDVLEQGPTLAVDSAVVTLDDVRIADTASLAADARVERIEPLIQRLETIKRNYAILHPNEDFPGAIFLQADLAVDYRVIKKLMFSAAQAGYGNVSFAVNRRSQKQ
jgi:biopolymer transport protein ExbD